MNDSVRLLEGGRLTGSPEGVVIDSAHLPASASSPLAGLDSAPSALPIEFI
jgi:hypothetical protein